MSSNTKVNFEVTGVNVNIGVAYVKYWADGATVERFGADIGPYEIIMRPECASMTDDQFKAYIASYGVEIVRRQELAMTSESVGANTKFESIVNTSESFVVEPPEVSPSIISDPPPTS